jgi:hypothetical protein
VVKAPFDIRFFRSVSSELISKGGGAAVLYVAKTAFAARGYGNIRFNLRVIAVQGYSLRGG